MEQHNAAAVPHVSDKWEQTKLKPTMIQDFGSGPWSTLEFRHKLEFPRDMAQSPQDEPMYLFLLTASAVC